MTIGSRSAAKAFGTLGVIVNAIEGLWLGPVTYQDFPRVTNSAWHNRH
jgi:hypothetical protein